MAGVAWRGPDAFALHISSWFRACMQSWVLRLRSQALALARTQDDNELENCPSWNRSEVLKSTAVDYVPCSQSVGHTMYIVVGHYETRKRGVQRWAILKITPADGGRAGASETEDYDYSLRLFPSKRRPPQRLSHSI